MCHWVLELPVNHLPFLDVSLPPERQGPSHNEIAALLVKQTNTNVGVGRDSLVQMAQDLSLELIRLRPIVQRKGHGLSEVGLTRLQVAVDHVWVIPVLRSDHRDSLFPEKVRDFLRIWPLLPLLLLHRRCAKLVLDLLELR